jgi:hypothetical protein
VRALCMWVQRGSVLCLLSNWCLISIAIAACRG